MSQLGTRDFQQALVEAYDKEQQALKIASNSVTTLIDEASSTVTYIGKALPGAATSAPSWQIQRITVSGTLTTVEYADGDGSFDNIWTLRASLSYF